MKLVVISGPPASGKLTVARELEQLTGWRVFHNHLTVDLLGAVFEFGSPPFRELRERIWLDVMVAAARAGLPGLIFTFLPEDTVSPGFFRRLEEQVREAGATTTFAALTTDEDEIERRLNAPSRMAWGKLRSVIQYRELRDAGHFRYEGLPGPAVTVDTGTFAPIEAARRILAATSP